MALEDANVQVNIAEEEVRNMLKSWWKRMTGETENADEQDHSYGNRPRTLQWLVILGCVGAAFMLFSSFISVRQEVIPAREPPSETGEAAETSALSGDGRPLSIEDYEDKMAAELSGTLGKSRRPGTSVSASQSKVDGNRRS